MLIGLIGNKRVGKTTLSNYLVNMYNFETIAFADPIKDAMQIAFDLSDEQVDGKLKEVVDKRWGYSPRQIFQKFGTDFARKLFGQDVWIKRLKIGLEKMKDKDVIVSDIRFPNEAEMVKKMGGHLVKITKSDLPVNSDSHISEQLIDKMEGDSQIRNDFTMNEYHQHIDKLMSHIYPDL